MRVTPIGSPLPGEHLAAVSPTLSPDVQNHWNRRLRLYPGRALSDIALTTEQNSRAGRLATYAQSLSAGVVTGLEVALERQEGSRRTTWYYHVAAGQGLTASGEDVTLPRASRVNVLDVQVCAPAFVFDNGSAAAPTRTYAEELLPRAVGEPSLRTLLKKRRHGNSSDHDTPPRVGILLLQPVVTEEVGAANAQDQCEQDAENYAFEDWQLIDGCRLVYYAWPTEWRPIPFADQLRRNRLAYTIFEAEQSLGAEGLLPWEPFGVALGVVGFNRRWKPLFFDRYAVARAGGKPKRRTAAMPANVGSPFLWQARVEQFAGQVADADLVGVPPSELSKQFRFLPPAGLLPRAAMDPRAGTDEFFPHTYHVEAVPVPVEQLDAALEGSAPLAPYDLSAPDEVQVLVPVPQPWFERDLLKTEEVSPEFAAAIDRAARRRDKLLKRRYLVRDRAQKLDMVTDLEPRSFPTPDPAAIDTSEPAGAELVAIEQQDDRDPFLEKGEDTFGLEVGGDDDAQVVMQSRGFPVLHDGQPHLKDNDAEIKPPRPLAPVVEQLWTSLRSRRFVMRTYVEPLAKDALPAGFALPAAMVDTDGEDRYADLRDRVRYTSAEGDADPEVLILRGPMTASDFSRLVELHEHEDYRNVLVTLLVRSQTNDLVELDELGLREFVTALEAKVKQADDRVDLSFARIQTDIYRVRQLMMGNEAATRLATSPVLATIAQGQTAIATQGQIRDFVAGLRGDAGQPNDETAPLLAGFQLPHLAKGVRPPTEGSAAPPPPPHPPIYDPGDVFSVEEAGHNLALWARAKRTAEAGRIMTARSSGGMEMLESVVEMAVREARAPASGTRLPTEVEVMREVAVERAPSIPAGTRAGGGTSPGSSPPARPNDVVGQSPLIGKTLDFRTMTLAERLAQPVAAEAKNFSVATKADILGELETLGIYLDDLVLPGFYKYKANGELDLDDVDTNGDNPRIVTTGINGQKRVLRIIPKETAHAYREIQKRGLTKQVLRGFHDLDPLNGDEGAFYAAAIRALDHAVAILRLVEGRIQAYRNVIDECNATLAALDGLRASADARLTVLEQELAESRQDVAVARALLGDEQRRVDLVNRRRDEIVASHVSFLAYRRPRMVDLLHDAPVRRLDPGLVQPVVPACLARRVAVPPDLNEVVNLLREVPIRWFRFLPPLLDRLDRVEIIREALRHAKIRAAVHYQTRLLAPIQAAMTTSLGLSIRNVLGAQLELVTQHRIRTAQLDLGRLIEQTWRHIRDHAEDVLSIGDLIDGTHGRADVARAGAEELNNMARVAGCLYQLFGEVAPNLRLQWAEGLSQYDDTVPLRNLASLPRWGEIEYLDRREMQGLVDWLFSRVDAGQPEATKFVDDIVRVALLLASHAPVNEIIDGNVAATATLQEGAQVELAADLTKVHIGMQVLMYAPAAVPSVAPMVIARAVVQDIGQGKVAAIVIQTAQPTVSIPAEAKAQFVEPEHPAAAAAAEAFAAKREISETAPWAVGAARLGKTMRREL